LYSAGEVKLADFGIAKLAANGKKTQVGVIIGTPSYLSYEQASSITVTPASDQYSLAIVMFEMLTGYLPFKGNPYEIISKHIDETPPSPKIYNSTISDEHESALLTALNKEHKYRFPSIMEFAHRIGYQPDKFSKTEVFMSESIYPISVPYIVGVQGFSAVEKIPMNTQSLILGRAMLPERPIHVSATHAEIQQIGPEFFIKDMGSKNGTYVNRLLVKEGEMMKLDHGCYINLGSTMIQFNLY
ncbi:MAG: FHA domain-containing protein, partial [Chloroflexota bacterium]